MAEEVSEPALRVQVGGKKVADADIRRAQKQCKRYGKDLGEKACIERFFVPRWLLDREVEQRKLAQAPAMRHLIDDLLHLGLVAEIEADIPPPSEEAIARFMKERSRDFEKPLRIRIFRLLVRTEEDAKQVLAQVKQPLDVAQFRQLCRKYSIDKATHERGGDLGFVWPDGSTDIPQVSADVALYEAALPLKEGELLMEPVPEDKRFALIWRRGSLPAQPSTEADRKRAAHLLQEQAREEALSALLEKLSNKRVKNRKDVLLGRLRRKESALFKEP